MSNNLEADLEQLVLDNWGLVYDLHRRAEALRVKLADTTKAIVRADAALANHGLSDEPFKTYLKGFYIPFPGLQKQHLAYIQMTADTDSAELAVSVCTKLTPVKGINIIKLKSGAFDRLPDPDPNLNMTSNVTFLEQRISLDEASLDDLPQQLAAEMIRQLPYAEALRATILDWKAKES